MTIPGLGSVEPDQSGSYLEIRRHDRLGIGLRIVRYDGCSLTEERARQLLLGTYHTTLHPGVSPTRGRVAAHCPGRGGR